MIFVTSIKNSPVFSAIMLGLIWAVAWAPIAILIGVTIIDPDNSMDEMWIAVGAYPGFLCGVAYRALLGIARTHLKMQGLSVWSAAAIGAAVGVLVAILPIVTAGSSSDPVSLFHRFAILSSIVAFSTLSAVITATVSASGR